MEFDADHRRRPGGKDLISDLPDDLLHNILVRLSSTAAAARTSVLSRRWRHVWAYMPELVLYCEKKTPGPLSSLDSIDAALRACSAPTLRRIDIRVYKDNIQVPRLTPWLYFASQRLAGSLDLSLTDFSSDGPYPRGEDELLLPLSERVTEIKLFTYTWTRVMLRLPVCGTFVALTHLDIYDTWMDGRELGRFVSSQCPCLRNLKVIGHLVADCDVSITSESLTHLRYRASGTNKFNVAAPELTKISLEMVKEAYIVAAKLEKINWMDGTYDPSRHQFVVGGRHLRGLRVNQSSTLLMQQFDMVDKLRLSFYIPDILNPCRASRCPCQGNLFVDNIKFDSLDEIEIRLFNGSVKQEELVLLLLSRCSKEILKKVDITARFYRVPSSNKRVCRRIIRQCSKNTEVMFHVYTKEGLVPFYP